MRVDPRAPQSNRAAAADRSVFSLPGQTAVADTTVLPWMSICAIEVGGANSPGTGWAFGQSMVVTAGHVLDDAEGAPIRIFPALDGGKASQPLHASSFMVGSNGDYAAIFFSGAPIERLGAFGIADPGLTIDGDTAVLAGFDPDEGALTLFTGSGPARENGPDRLRYDISTVFGQSGAPVWLDGDERRLVGIHMGRVGGFIQAQRLTEGIIADLLQWREDSERGLFRAASRVAVNLRTLATRASSRIGHPIVDHAEPVLLSSEALSSATVGPSLAVPAALNVRPVRGRAASSMITRGAAVIRRAGTVPHDVEDVVSRPVHAPDTVIVKMRDETTPEPAARAARLALPLAGTPRHSVLDELVRNGYAMQVSSVFAERALQFREMASVRSGQKRPRGLSRTLNLQNVTVAPSVNAMDLAAHLAVQREVEYAFVPAVKYPFATRTKARKKRPIASAVSGPNDPMRPRQWNHAAIKLDRARAMPDFCDGAAITVAIVDSGVDRNHPDLAGVVSSYQNFLTTEDDRDYKGHGTHVTGIVSAVINNALGVAGICAARIMALKALPRASGRWDAQAYYRALAHPIGTDARVLNLSLGGALDRAEQDIIADLLDNGVTVVAAMGNEFKFGNPVSYPAAYDGVVAIGASDQVDRRASFSCTGPHIALVAPGVDILSTVPSYATELAATTEYDSWPGTSMAAPHVTAAAALLIAREPTLTPVQVRRRLLAAAERVGWQADVPDLEYGSGRLDIAALLQ